MCGPDVSAELKWLLDEFVTNVLALGSERNFTIAHEEEDERAIGRATSAVMSALNALRALEGE